MRPQKTKCVKPDGLAAITGYTTYGCRCMDCRIANFRHGSGQGESVYVDAAEAVEHVNRLMRYNVSVAQIAAASGLERRVVSRMVRGHRRPVFKKIRPAVAKAVLAVTRAQVEMAGDGRVSATGTLRQARALAAIGWSFAEQASRIGMAYDAYRQMLGRERISAAHAQAVAALYDQLCLTLGPSEITRAMAAQKNWGPPLAWDEESIYRKRGRPNRSGRASGRCGEGHELNAETASVDPYSDQTVCLTCHPQERRADRGEHEQATAGSET